MTASALLPAVGLGVPRRRSRSLFDWRANDLSLDARTGQAGTLARNTFGYASDANGILYPTGEDQPRWHMADRNGDGIPDTPTLLLEGVSTNLFLYSSAFNTGGVWNPVNCSVTPNAAIAPDGTLTASLITATTTAATLLVQAANVVGTVASYSVYARKKSGATKANGFLLYDATAGATLAQASLNYDTGVLTFGAGGPGYVERLPGGWYRITLSATITSGHSIVGYPLFTSGPATAGDAAYIWHAQLEALSTSTSPIPTGGAAVARLGDALEWAHNDIPRALSFYHKCIALPGSILGSAQLGDDLFVGVNSGGTVAQYTSDVGSITAPEATATFVRGDVVECLVTLSAASDLSVSLSVNGGALHSATAAAIGPLDASWSQPRIQVSSYGAALQNVRVETGVRTMDQMRSLF